ncbi:MAG: cupin domain-containing protein [Dehalococcoidia bacterium]|nr:MAG: cupin domain-containing protein [Dehalococcoidia bacterium]
MVSPEFPAFIRGLPEAELPFVGLRGWLLQSESGQVLFNESDTDVTVPEHTHGDQWGIVISGKIELTIGEQNLIFARGNTYFIPKGTPHRARIFPGFRAVDYFADRDRYQSRSQGL